MRWVAARAGKTWVRDVNPAGVPVRRRWAEAGGSLVCEERELEHEDRVTRVEVAREGGLVAVTVTDQATGTSFRELFAFFASALPSATSFRALFAFFASALPP